MAARNGSNSRREQDFALASLFGLVSSDGSERAKPDDKRNRDDREVFLVECGRRPVREVMFRDIGVQHNDAWRQHDFDVLDTYLYHVKGITNIERSK